MTRQLVVELEQGDRGARHVERRDVVADELPTDRDATAGQDLGDLPINNVELDQWRATEAVDEGQDLVTTVEQAVVEDRIDEHLDDLVSRGQLDPATARLTVDADADLHLVVADLERRLAGRGNRAARERHAHRAHVVLDLLAECRDGGQIGSRLGRRTDDLFGQHGSTHATAASGIQRVLDRDVVGDHDRGDLDTFGTGQLGGDLEVHDVAGVVLDDVEDACAAVDGLGGGHHLIGDRRGEDGARAGRVEHSEPDEASAQSVRVPNHHQK